MLTTHFSFFCSQITQRRMDDETLGLLETLMICKDAKSLIDLQSTLRDFLRSQSISIFREIAEKSVEQKLSILEFFVCAFAIIGDMESCLALKYEALHLREIKSLNCQSLRVSYIEWLDFAQQLIDSGFYSSARQACENAIFCLRKDDVVSTKTSQISLENRIQSLRDHAVHLANLGSVQAQAADYLNWKTIEKRKLCSSFENGTQITASILFRNGIKKQNIRKLHESMWTAVNSC